MNKMTSKVALSMAIAAIALTGGNASAAQQMQQNNPMAQAMQIGPSIASSMMNGMPPGASSGSTSQQVNLTEVVGQAIHALPSQQRDQLATQMTGGRQLLQSGQGFSSLNPQELEQLTRSMIGGNMPLLRELNGQTDKEKIEPDAAATQVMGKIRDQIMQDSYTNISQYGQNTYRTLMQPQVVQRMINNIRPWEFPTRFKGQMMPILSPKMGEQIQAQIQEQQKQFLKDGMK